MTFQLNTIKLNNFRSYRGTHSFEFPQTSGLYFFTGENRLDDLGANGAGKSTFLDAIVWCLYGKTPRGLRSNDVLTWDAAGGCSVELDMVIGEPLTVKRSQKPNGIWVNKTPVDQLGLDKHLGLSYEAFLHSVLNAQFGSSFFSLSPAAKLEMFSQIMNLDFWLGKSKLAAKKAEEIDAKINDLEKFIAREKGRKEAVKADIEDLGPKEANFEDETTSEIRSVSNRLEGAEKTLAVLYEDEKALNKQKAEFMAKKEQASYALAQTEKNLDFFLKEIQKASERKAVFKDRMDYYNGQLHWFKSTKHCTQCMQKVDDAHAAKHKARFLDEYVQAEEAFKLENEIIQNTVKSVAKTKTEIASKQATYKDWEENFREACDRIREFSSDLSASEDERTRCKHELAKLKAKKNPFTEMLDLKRADLKSICANLKKFKSEIEQLEAQHAATVYWVKGFKQIRLHIIEEAFQALELEVNNSLSQLGMADWVITFDIERENKSGGVTKGFVVFIKGPHNSAPVRWESWSGGETQRLQLAGDLGLANLIMQQHGLTNTIEIFDEPSTHLSKEGMLDLANLLYDRAITDQKQIWIVDHTSMSNFGEFTGVITARKTKDGSDISLEV